MIYIVTKGSYSDYHVIAATVNRELAEKIREKFDDDYGWDECCIEEFPDAEVMLKNLWRVFFDKNGEAFASNEADNEYSYKEINDVVEFGYGSPYELYVTVEADTEEAAIKIAAEKRAVYLAMKNGL